jgi:hypothetical protein
VGRIGFEIDQAGNGFADLAQAARTGKGWQM